MKRSLVLLVFFSAIALAMPRIISPSSLREKEPFDPRPLARLKGIHPEVVLIGNSLLRTRINERLLGKSLGCKVGLMAEHGSMSARWYLYLKNYVVGAHPKKVIIFFRDDELTQPRYRIEGRYRKAVEIAMSGDESEFVNKLREREDFEWFYFILEKIYPSFSDSYRIHENARGEFLVKILGQRGYNKLTRYQKPFFENGELREDLAADNAGTEKIIPLFSESLEPSFLPDIIEVAKVHKIHLAFFRVKTRHSFSRADSPDLANYVSDLRHYLESHGAIFIDETNATDIPLRYYSDGDHIGRRHQRDYTKLFAKRIKGLLL